jgi:Domain of unknown function (DUF4132)/Family of unknown function (DUF5724)
MLTRDEAQKRLEKDSIKNWETKRLAELAKLPAKLCALGRGIFGRSASGQPIRDWSKQNAARQAALDKLDDLKPAERERLFFTLFPRLGADIERGWQLTSRLTYTRHSTRRAFRAPTSPEATKEVRTSWFYSLFRELQNYNPDIEWVASWAPHLGYGYGADCFGVLLAAAIDAGGPGGETVFEILKQSATNEHEIGHMGRHVSRALMTTSRPDGWEFMEKLLLAAQRQEGLRQVILEGIDEAHPQAFRRMLRLILDQNLIRFSACVRAADVWFGMQWESATPGVIKKALQQAITFLDDSAARTEAIRTATDDSLYLALWSIAFDDADNAIAPAAALLSDSKVERRFIAAHFLEELHLPGAQAALVPAVDDSDLRIAVRAFNALAQQGAPASLDLFETTCKLLDRLPEKPTELPALVWPWATTQVNRQSTADHLANHLGKRPATVLLPYLASFSPWGKVRLMEKLTEGKATPTGQVRDTLFSLIGDRNSWVRNRALEAVKKCEVTAVEAEQIEGFLSRKDSTMRQGVFALLRKQKNPHVLASADRLLASKKAPQRVAGLELLRILVDAKRVVSECRERARAYLERRPQPDEDEQDHLDAILNIHRVVPTLDDALGLMDPSKRTLPTPPQVRKVTPLTSAAVECLKAIDALIDENLQTTVILPERGGEGGLGEQLFGNLHGWHIPLPPADVEPSSAITMLPLHDVWENWYENRPKKQRDRDGLELLRALLWHDTNPDNLRAQKKQYARRWKDYFEFAPGDVELASLKRADLIERILEWLIRLHPPQKPIDFLLDIAETCYALVPKSVYSEVHDLNNWQQRHKDWRHNSPIFFSPENVSSYTWIPGAEFTPAHAVRVWNLLHWCDQPVPAVPRVRPDFEHVLNGFLGGAANETDILDGLLGPGDSDQNKLGWLLTPTAWDRVRCPALIPLVERCRDRILEIELKRGETPTAATEPARVLRYLPGSETLFRLIARLGKKRFARNRYSRGRVETLTHLINVTYPTLEDTNESFKARVKEAGLSRETLLELAFLAPQWLPHIDFTLGWPGLTEGVYWFYAHMSGAGSPMNEYPPGCKPTEPGAHTDEERIDPWDQFIRERTPLTDEERREGAVDVGWFRRAYEPLGKKRWEALVEAAKYGCTDRSFKKAGMLAAVILGRAKKRDLIRGVRDLRLKESVRFLGLLPLASGAKREVDLLHRYRALQEYRRYARSLGPMSRESAVRAGAIGLENLARTAGYPDPVRLEWAMEAREIADLAAGPIAVTHQGVTVTLSLDADAQANVTVQRGEKTLKNVPAPVRKHPRIAALTERKADLRRQASRVRQSLEQAMLRGDRFTGAELRQLFLHPVLKPLLERLVLFGDGKNGYPIENGAALRNHDGRRAAIGDEDRLRIAHVWDLYASGEWDRWQRECFRAERVQPFKQVFRELYLVTEQERRDGPISHRYTGHQVNPKQAMALFGGRGWQTTDGVSRTFYQEGYTAHVSFRSGWGTPLEVEGLTFDDVRFTRRGEWETIPLEQVPSIIFSEVMRDADLVVSVAHLGGVDPEASASTVEMRASLVKEACDLLKIANYTLQGAHVLIEGGLGKYSVHLGSGIVHRQPGGALCIIAVGAQHRGRLFLPFADDDPRTAEVLSKVLLLTRDTQIQDPTILEQLR